MHLKHSRTPHFMSPTIASTHGQPPDTTPKATKNNTPPVAPPTTSGKKKRNWVASAVKRVGMSRSSNNSTRPNNEQAPSLGADELSAPEKVTPTSSHVGVKGASAVDGASRNKYLPTNKPLPSPPVASIVKADEQSSARSLLDASDKPLRRTPPGKPTEPEEWPTIIPEKRTTPTGAHRFPYQGESGAEAQHITAAAERYPRLSSSFLDQANTAMASTASVQREPLHDDTSANAHSFRRKPAGKLPSPESGTSSGVYKVTGATASPNTTRVKKPRNFSLPRQTRTSSLRARLSSGGLPSDGITPSKANSVVSSATSKGKLDWTQHGPSDVSQVSKGLPHGASHQIAGAPSGEATTASVTSHVLSSGASIEDSESAQLSHTNVPPSYKELDGTSGVINNRDDSTVGKGKPELKHLVPTDDPNLSGPGYGLHGTSNGNLAPTSTTSDSAQLNASVSSTHRAQHQASYPGSDKGRAGRPPARTVAGVRRGSRVRTNRLSGRYNVRLTNAVGSHNHGPAEASANTISVAQHSEPLAAEAITGELGCVQKSVPGDHNINTEVKTALDIEGSSAAKEVSSVKGSEPAAESNFMGFNDIPAHNIDAETHGDSSYYEVGRDMHPTPQPVNGPLEDVLAEYTEHSAAKATGEINFPGYTVKRLSKVSPENGPTLRIALSADQVIMGSPSSDKENKDTTTNENKSKDSRRTALTNEVRKAFRVTKIPTATKHSRLSRSASTDLLSRSPRVSTHLRDKKTRSADAELLFSRVENDPFTDGHKPVPTGITHSKGLLSKGSLNRGKDKSTFGPHMSSDGPADFRSPSAAAQSNCSNLASYTTAAQEIVPAIITTSHDNQKSSRLTPQDPTPGGPTHAGSRTRDHAGSSKMVSSGREDRTPSGGFDNTTLLTPPTPHYGSQTQEATYWPPRSSSKTPGSEYTTPPYISSQATQGRIVDPRLSRDFRLIQEAYETPGDTTFTPPDPETETSKRTSQASKQSSQGSHSKNVLSMSNLRGLFRRGHNHSKGEERTPAPSSKSSRKYTISAAGSPFTSRPESSTARSQSRQQSSPATSVPSPHLLISVADSPSISRPESGAARAQSREQSSPAASVPSPHLLQVPRLTNSSIPNSPTSSQVSETTSLAMGILESARNEAHGPRKERLLEMGKIMVDVITHARDAEKAMEEAKVSADKAQMAYMMTKKTVFDVAKMVEEWKEELDAE